jgi:hypothetical protein
VGGPLQLLGPSFGFSSNLVNVSQSCSHIAGVVNKACGENPSRSCSWCRSTWVLTFMSLVGFLQVTLFLACISVAPLALCADGTPRFPRR